MITKHNTTTKKALYIGHVGSEGTAMAIHARNIASLLDTFGYQVAFVCQCVPKGHKEYDRHDRYRYCYTKQYIRISKIRAIEWMLEELTGAKLVHLFKRTIKAQSVDLVIFYGYSGEKNLIEYCRKNHIKILVDRTDWFEASDRKGIFGTVFTKYCADKCIEKYDIRADGVISISKYFYDYYRKRGQNTIWIPPIFKIKRLNRFEKSKGDPIRLVYAGSLGNAKDIIDPIVDSVLTSFNKDKIVFILDLVGINETQLDSRFGDHNWKALGIYAYGRRPHAEAEQIVSGADFSFLLRQDKRYAKAGFSTKFAESMSKGVPVICTQVGGADLLVKDMENGILLKNNEKETLEAALHQISRFSKETIAAMKKEAYQSALEYFDYHSYERSLKKFIESN